MADSDKAEESGKDRATTLSRRKLMAMASAGAAGLAGCGGGDGGDGGGTTEDTTTTDTGGGLDLNETDTTTTEGGEDGGDLERKQYPRPDNTGSQPMPVDVSTIERKYADADPIDPHAVHVLGRSTQDVASQNLNPLAQTPSFVVNQRTRHLIYEQLANRAFNGFLYYPTIALDSIEVEDPCTLVGNLREDMQWWDGTPVTAKDLETQSRLANYQTYGLNFNTTGNNPYLEVVDDYTIRQHFQTPQNDFNMRSEFVGNINIKHDYHKEWRELYEDASTKEELDQATATIGKTTIDWETFMDESLGNGLWIPDLDTVNPNSFTVRLNEDHRRAHFTNLDSIEIMPVGDSQKRLAMYRNDEADFAGSTELVINDQGPSTAVKNYQRDEAKLSTAYSYDWAGGWRIQIGRHNPHTNRKAFRRAMAYMYSTRKYIELSGTVFTPSNLKINMSGLAPAGAGTLLDDEFTDKLINYGKEEQPEKAAETLRKGGYQKQGGKWVGPDGNTASVTGIAPPVPRFRAVTQMAVEQLKKLGVETTLKTPSWSAYGTILEEKPDEYDIATTWGIAPLPTNMVGGDFSVTLPAYAALPDGWTPPTGEGCEVVTPDPPELATEREPIYQRPVRPEVPAIGDTALDASGSYTLNPIMWNEEMLQTADPELWSDRTKKLVWYFNQTAETIPAYIILKGLSGNTVDYWWGDGEYDEQWYNSIHTKIAQGWMTGRDEENWDPYFEKMNVPDTPGQTPRDVIKQRYMSR